MFTNVVLSYHHKLQSVRLTFWGVPRFAEPRYPLYAAHTAIIANAVTLFTLIVQSLAICFYLAIAFIK